MGVHVQVNVKGSQLADVVDAPLRFVEGILRIIDVFAHPFCQGSGELLRLVMVLRESFCVRIFLGEGDPPVCVLRIMLKKQLLTCSR